MAEVLEIVAEAMANKIPAVRTETLLWFGKCIELSVTTKPRNRVGVNKTNLKGFMTIIMLVCEQLFSQTVLEPFGNLLA
jgi:ribosomal protein S7